MDIDIDEAFPGSTFNKKAVEFRDGGKLRLRIASIGRDYPNRQADKQKLKIEFDGEERIWWAGQEAAESLCRATGHRTTGPMIGMEIFLYVDMSVNNPRDRSDPGGVRAMAVGKQTPAPAREEASDDIPF